MANRFLKIFVPIVLVAAVVVAVLVWTGRASMTDRQRILKNLTSAERAVEQSSVSGLMAVVSENYEDTYGNTKRQLTRLAVGALRENDWEVDVQLVDMSVEGSTASTSLQVGVWPVESPGGRRVYDMTVQWQKENGHWRAVGSSGWSDAQSDFMF